MSTVTETWTARKTAEGKWHVLDTAGKNVSLHRDLVEAVYYAIVAAKMRGVSVKIVEEVPK